MPDKTAYLCNIDKNVACAKTMCTIHGGPCIATTDPKYAWKDVHGKPIVADEDELDKAASKYFEHRKVE